jgi:leucyl/phenylalanyl-tRNA--protein transferase
MHILNSDIKFPNVNTANDAGILAIGGDLSVKRLHLAYKSGIFPWYNEDEPIIWYSPSVRMVLFPEDVKISKSMRQIFKKSIFEISFNKAFESVIAHCKAIPRDGQLGTWITDDMEKAYIKLHKLGIAKSVEVWQNSKLVGGLYGIDLGTVFCGESMFSLVSNASKFAFISLAKHLQKEQYSIIDCQVYNEHLESLGAIEISRDSFMRFLK